jgi:predicted signal transduction protein with EAL and GGDEF domain
MSITAGQELRLPYPVERDPAPAPDGADLAAAARRVRHGIVNIVVGAFLLSMVVVTLGALMATPASPATLVVLIASLGAAAMTVSRAVLLAILRRMDEVGRLVLALRSELDRVSLDAIRDPLTGLGNHRAFQEELDRAASLAFRHRQSTALLLIDVDDLKRVNDAEGHAAGDEVLRTVARVIAMTGRRTDRAFRIGGDEFAVLSQSSTTA